jgi:AcrR family transcriptional regulator
MAGGRFVNGSKDKINQTIYGELFPRALSKADQKKLIILEAAIQTYAELGIEYVSYEDIARKAKVTRPLVNHYFPDKKILFESAMKFIRAHFQELAIRELERTSSPKEKLQIYVRSTMTWVHVSPVHAKAWVFFFYLCASDSKLRNLHRELTTMGMQRLTALLHAVAAESSYPTSHLEEKAKGIQRLITGALLEIATEHDPKNIKILEEITRQTIAQCLDICRRTE